MNKALKKELLLKVHHFRLRHSINKSKANVFNGDAFPLDVFVEIQKRTEPGENNLLKTCRRLYTELYQHGDRYFELYPQWFRKTYNYPIFLGVNEIKLKFVERVLRGSWVPHGRAYIIKWKGTHNITSDSDLWKGIKTIRRQCNIYFTEGYFLRCQQDNGMVAGVAPHGKPFFHLLNPTTPEGKIMRKLHKDLDLPYYMIVTHPKHEGHMFLQKRYGDVLTRNTEFKRIDGVWRKHGREDYYLTLGYSSIYSLFPARQEHLPSVIMYWEGTKHGWCFFRNYELESRCRCLQYYNMGKRALGWSRKEDELYPSLLEYVGWETTSKHLAMFFPRRFYWDKSGTYNIQYASLCGERVHVRKKRRGFGWVYITTSVENGKKKIKYSTERCD